MKRLFPLLLACLLLLTGCRSTPQREDQKLHILCTTYPVYLFTTAITADIEDVVEVSLLVTSQTSCLHDYTLSVKDMRAVERADVIVLNGAGLEDFLDDALSHSSAALIDCSRGIELLSTQEHKEHENHAHSEEYDPHIWMDPRLAARMVENIAAGLSVLLPAREESFTQAKDAALLELPYVDPAYRDAVYPPYPLVTFHDGFQYFIRANDFQLLKAIEEEEGATASAREMKELIALIRAEQLPAIFVEKNGSRATADAISRETGCKVYELDMIMAGMGSGIRPYTEAIAQNVMTIMEAFR